MTTVTTAHHSRVAVDAAILQHNYETVSAYVGPEAEVLAVVKAQAYGHGLETAAQAFFQGGCRSFCVVDNAEADRVRTTLGDSVSILRLLPALPDEYSDTVDLNCETVLVSLDDARSWADWLQRQGRRLEVHLKVDRGMGRLGFGYKDLFPALEFIAQTEQFELVGLMSHLPASQEEPLGDVSDETKRGYHTSNEIRRFQQVCLEVEKWLKTPLKKHLANSGATLYHPESHFDLTRVGLALYGADPRGRDLNLFGIEPALTVSSRVLQIRHFEPGATIGYGREHIVASPTNTAVVPVGYSDGLLCSMAGKQQVLIHGQRCSVLGRVSMNLISVELPHGLSVNTGDPVVVVGRQGDHCIRVEDLARWAGTIPYEILTALGSQRSN